MLYPRKRKSIKSAQPLNTSSSYNEICSDSALTSWPLDRGFLLKIALCLDYGLQSNLHINLMWVCTQFSTLNFFLVQKLLLNWFVFSGERVSDQDAKHVWRNLLGFPPTFNMTEFRKGSTQTAKWPKESGTFLLDSAHLTHLSSNSGMSYIFPDEPPSRENVQIGCKVLY